MDNLALFMGYAFITIFAACLLYFLAAAMAKVLREKVYYPIRDCIRYRTPSIVSCRCRDCLYSEKMDGAIRGVYCTSYRMTMPANGFCSYSYRINKALAVEKSEKDER